MPRFGGFDIIALLFTEFNKGEGAAGIFIEEVGIIVEFIGDPLPIEFGDLFTCCH